jgi:hypothetical protein
MSIVKKISELKRWHWGQDAVSCEPLDEDITKAVQARDFEPRMLQDPAVESELMGEQNLEQRYARIKQYHARRIAYLVEHKWNDPLVLFDDGCWIKDGSHRLRAAQYLRMKEVDCVFCTQKP